MAEVKDRPASHPDLKPTNTLTIDGDFLRGQAAEALATFFAPLSGIVTAATGKHRPVKMHISTRPALARRPDTQRPNKVIRRRAQQSADTSGAYRTNP